MAILPKMNPAVGLNIANLLNDTSVVQEQRGYLGYSGSGEQCLRKIWYSFYWAEKEEISEQTNRIFGLGHLLEAEIKRDLRVHGFEITDEQLAVEGCYGHAKGHIDGIILIPSYTEKMLLEIKTCNDLAFNTVVKRGVKKEMPKHYLQMQGYMGKLNLNNALYVLYNKNTSEYYTEIVEFNKSAYEDIDRKFTSILMSEFPPNKIGDIDYYACQWCMFKDICHQGATPPKNCRTCNFASVEMQGKWSCDKKNQNLNEDEQRVGCKIYKRNPII